MKKPKKPKKQKIILGRIPLPRNTGGAQGTKKGKKGYDRKKDKEVLNEDS